MWNMYLSNKIMTSKIFLRSSRLALFWSLTKSLSREMQLVQRPYCTLHMGPPDLYCHVHDHYQSRKHATVTANEPVFSARDIYLWEGMIISQKYWLSYLFFRKHTAVQSMFVRGQNLFFRQVFNSWFLLWMIYMIVTQSMSKTKLCRVKAKVSTLNKRVCLTLSARVNLFGGNKQPAGSRIGLAAAQNKQEKKCLRTQIQLPIHPALIKHSCHVKVRDANDPIDESHSFSSPSLFHFDFFCRRTILTRRGWKRLLIVWPTDGRIWSQGAVIINIIMNCDNKWWWWSL